MPRSRFRASRAVIIVLVVALVLGAAASIHKLSSSKANASGDAAAGSAQNGTPQPGATPKVDPARVDKPKPAPITPHPATKPAQILTTVTPHPGDAPIGGPTTAPITVVPPNIQPGGQGPNLINHTVPTGQADETPKPTDNTPKPKPVAAPAGHSATGALAQAKSAMSANEFSRARTLLSDALLAGTLSATDAGAARQMLTEIGATLTLSTRRFNDDAFAGLYQVQSGEIMKRIAAKFDVTANFLCRINGLTDARKLRAGANIKIVKGPFHIVVTKSKFTLDLYLGNPNEKGSVFVGQYLVGLGRDNSTPTGIWIVEQGKKLPNPRYYPSDSARAEGEVVRESDDPKNPLGKFWIGLKGVEGDAEGKDSYGIHGTIEPDSIGKEASHGCIRMKAEDISLMFDLLVEGKSTVTVKP